MPYLPPIEHTLHYLEYQLPDGSLLARLLPNDEHFLAPDTDALRERLQSNYRDEVMGNVRRTRTAKRIELKLLEVSTQLVRGRNRRRPRLLEQAVELKIPAVRIRQRGSWFARAFFPDGTHNTIHGEQVRQIHHRLRVHAEDYFAYQSPHEVLAAVRITPPVLKKMALTFEGEREAKTTGPGAVPALASFAYRFHPKRAKSKVPDLLIGRDREVEEVQRILRTENGSALLTGESRVGKSAILRRAWGKLDEEQRKPGLWILDPAYFERDVEHFGDYQQNVDKLVEAAEASGGVLWLQNLDALLLPRDNNQQPVLIMNYLAGFMRAGRVRLVAEATPEQQRVLKRRVPDLMAAFTTVAVAPMNEAEGMRVLVEMANAYRKQRRFPVSPEATRRIHRLMMRFHRDRSFPGKSVRFLHDAVAHQRRRKQTELTETDVLAYFHHATGLPAAISDEFQANDPRAHFKQRIIGQERAVEVLTQTVNVFRAGINDPGKPVRVLLFAGPTGVGKTESVVALAEYFYGAEGRKRLLRVDMSEYNHPFRVRRLVGEGTTPSPLVERVREQPFTIILLDEIEKAHASVWTTLMTLFDEGTLTDAAGRTTDFSNTIIVLTSNLGSNEARGVRIGAGANEDQRFLGAVRRELPPEVRNRIDETVVFQPLRPEHMARIARLTLERYAERPGFRDRNLQLKFSEALVAEVGRRGYDPERGARALRQAVDLLVGRVLNDRLFHEPSLADRTLRLDWRDSGLVVE